MLANLNKRDLLKVIIKERQGNRLWAELPGITPPTALPIRVIQRSFCPQRQVAAGLEASSRPLASPVQGAPAQQTPQAPPRYMCLSFKWQSSERASDWWTLNLTWKLWQGNMETVVERGMPREEWNER